MADVGGKDNSIQGRGARGELWYGLGELNSREGKLMLEFFDTFTNWLVVIGLVWLFVGIITIGRTPVWLEVWLEERAKQREKRRAKRKAIWRARFRARQKKAA